MNSSSKVTDYPDRVNLTGGEYLYLAADGQDFKGTVDQVAGYVASSPPLADAVNQAQAAAEEAQDGAAYVESVLPNLLTKSEAAASDGATKVGTTSGTVQEALNQRPTTTDLTAPTTANGLGKTPETGSNANSVGGWLDNIGPAYNFFGVIRQTVADAGWSFLNDGGHLSRGFNGSAPFTANPDGTLTVPFNFSTYKVGSISVNGDETFAALGLAIGSSTGTSSLTLSAFKTLDAAINVSTKAVTPSAFFASKVTATVDGTDPGVTVIDHPNCGSASVVPTITGADVNQAFDNRVIAYASLATQVKVATFTPFYGFVSWNGSAFVVSTACKNKPTFSFNGTTGALTVTHELLSTAESIVWVRELDDQFGGSYLEARSATNQSTTTFIVYFRDPATGSVITTPANTMKFVYGSPANVRRELPAGVIGIKRENAKLDFAKVASGSGNIWLNGPMWKT